MSPPPAAAALLALAALLLAACAASRSRDHACMPAKGMGTEQLTACGCRRYDGGSMRTLPSSRTAGGAVAKTVIIVNYICPLGDAGVAWATVINGVVERVDY